MIEKHALQIQEGEKPRLEDSSSSQAQSDNIIRFPNQYSPPKEKRKPVSYTDGIASSSGLSGSEKITPPDLAEVISGSEKITPPDLAEVIKSRMGRTIGREIALGHTLPEFLHKGRGGTYDQAVEYWNKIPEDEYSEETFREIENMSESDGRERLKEIFEEKSSSNIYEGVGSGYEKSDSDSEIGEEREDDIKGLANKIAELPGDWYNKHPSQLSEEDIRAHMVDNKLGRKELAYARKHLENRGNLNEEEIKQTLSVIEDHYFD